MFQAYAHLMSKGNMIVVSIVILKQMMGARNVIQIMNVKVLACVLKMKKI